MGSTVADIAFVREVAAATDYLAVVAVAREDGTVHASLVKAGVLEDPMTGGDAVGIVVAGNATKLGLLRQRRHATVVFRDGWRWVSVEGAVRFYGPDDPADGGGAEGDATLPPVPEVLRTVFTAAGGTHDDWAEFDRVMAGERRCAVLVHVDAIRTN